MRRAGRRSLNTVLSVGIFLFLVSGVAIYSNSIILPFLGTSSPKTVATAEKPVIELLPAVTESVVKEQAYSLKYTANSSSCTANGIPGDCSDAVGKLINGKLIDLVPDTVKFVGIFSEKNPQGLNFGAASSMTYEYQAPTPSNSTVKPEVKKFSLCEPDGKNKGVAQLVVKPLVLPPYLTEPDTLGMRQMGDEDLFVVVSALWFNNLTPERAEDLCDVFTDPTKNDYNQMWSAQIGKAGGGAANSSKQIIDYIVARCSTRSPGLGVGNSEIFSKEFIQGHKDEKSVTFKILLPDNVKEDQFDGRELAVKKLDLSGTISFAGERLFQIYAWQAEDELDYRKMKNIGIAISMLYDMLEAAPQYSTGAVGKTATASKVGSLLTVPKNDDKKQMETSRETILSAVTGGLWVVDEMLYQETDKASFLSFDPKTRDTETAYCSTKSVSKCHLVASQSSCQGFNLTASAEVEGLYLSSPDLQEYAQAVQKGDVSVSYAFNRAGDSFQGGITRMPSLLDQATVEQIVLASGKVTTTCAGYLQKTIELQRSQSRPLGVTEEEFESMKKYWKLDTYWNQGAMAIPTRVSGVAFNDYKPNGELLAFLKVFLPGLTRLIYKDCDNPANPSMCVVKTNIPERYVPTLMNIKLDAAYTGANTEAPAAKNAKVTPINQQIRDYFKRQYILPIDDFSIDCSDSTVSNSTNPINPEIWQNMWICQTKSNGLFTQCQ